MDILVVGLGNMGLAIASSLQNSKNIFIYSYDPQSVFAKHAKTLSIRHFSTLSSLFTNIKSISSHSEKTKSLHFDVIIIAVKPQVINTTLTELLPLITSHKPLIISIVAGIEIKTISQSLNNYKRIVRYMPTIAALKQKSITAISTAQALQKKDITTAVSIAKQFGAVMHIDEKQMPIFTGMAGSGIAFATKFIDSLMQAGIKQKLSYDNAFIAASHAVLGALAMLNADITQTQYSSTSPSLPSLPVFKTPQELINVISSPKGTTVAGMAVLKKEQFSKIIAAAVKAASKRAKELSQKNNHIIVS